MLITDKGLPRVIDFRNAGTVADRHLTVPAPGNSQTTPLDVRKGGRRGEIADDVYALAALAFQLLTGQSLPAQENDWNPGDSVLMACAQGKLAALDAHLQQVLLKGLDVLDRRHQTAAALAAEQHHAQRPVRILRRCLATAVAASLLMLGYLALAGDAEDQHRFELRTYGKLKERAVQLVNGDHRAVKPLIEQADQMEQDGFDRGEIAQAGKLLGRACEIDAGLTAALPWREALTNMLNEYPFEDAQVIAGEKKRLAERNSQIAQALDEGRTGDAQQSLLELHQGLTALIAANRQAKTVRAAKDAYDDLKNSLPEEIRRRPEFAEIDKLAISALAGWNAADWDNAAKSYGQAWAVKKPVLTCDFDLVGEPWFCSVGFVPATSAAGRYPTVSAAIRAR